MNLAVKEVCGDAAALPPLDAFKVFDRLWASKIDPKSSWCEIDEQYRGKGAAGAIAYLGMGELVSASQIWKGELKPGALLQVWDSDAEFEKVFAGDAPDGIGHSFIFLEYKKNQKGEIIGMLIADKELVGANLASLKRVCSSTGLLQTFVVRNDSANSA